MIYIIVYHKDMYTIKSYFVIVRQLSKMCKFGIVLNNFYCLYFQMSRNSNQIFSSNVQPYPFNTQQRHPQFTNSNILVNSFGNQPQFLRGNSPKRSNLYPAHLPQQDSRLSPPAPIMYSHLASPSNQQMYLQPTTSTINVFQPPSPGIVQGSLVRQSGLVQQRGSFGPFVPNAQVITQYIQQPQSPNYIPIQKSHTVFEQDHLQQRLIVNEPELFERRTIKYVEQPVKATPPPQKPAAVPITSEIKYENRHSVVSHTYQEPMVETVRGPSWGIESARTSKSRMVPPPPPARESKGGCAWWIWGIVGLLAVAGLVLAIVLGNKGGNTTGNTAGASTAPTITPIQPVATTNVPTTPVSVVPNVNVNNTTVSGNTVVDTPSVVGPPTNNTGTTSAISTQQGLMPPATDISSVSAKTVNQAATTPTTPLVTKPTSAPNVPIASTPTTLTTTPTATPTNAPTATATTTSTTTPPLTPTNSIPATVSPSLTTTAPVATAPSTTVQPTVAPVTTPSTSFPSTPTPTAISEQAPRTVIVEPPTATTQTQPVSVFQPVSTQPASVQSVSTQPTSVQPVSTQPASVPPVQPVATQPASVPPVQPVSTQPASVPPVQPVSTQPVSVPPVQPVSTQPVSVPPVQPVSTQPVSVPPVQPASVPPASIQPVSTQPASTTASASAIQPSTTSKPTVTAHFRTNVQHL